MAGAWPARRVGDLDDIDTWLSQRNADIALRPQADALGRVLWNQGTQSGNNLSAPRPSDLTAIGLTALMNGPAGLAGQVVSNEPIVGPDGGDLSAMQPVNEGGETAGYGTGQSAPANDGWQEAQPPSGIDPVPRRGLVGGEQSGLNPRPSPNVIDAGPPLVDPLEIYGPTHPPQGDALSWDRSPAVKALAGAGAFLVGLPVGVGRSVYHAAGDLKDAALFAGELVNPFDPDGRAEAAKQARDEVHGALQYGRSVIRDPGRLASDAAASGKAALESMNPFAAPMADTAWGEMKHEFGVGKNVGEAGANLAGLLGGGEAIEGLRAIRAFEATREANIAKRVAQGLDRETAEYLSKPYEGKGHHAIVPQRLRTISSEKWPIPIPPVLEGKTLPKWFMDGPLNVSKPRGMSQGDFYDYHFGVDKNFYGAKLPPGLNQGKGWSGRRLDLERYSLPERLWRGTPTIWKDGAALVDLGKVPGVFEGDGQGPPQ